MSVDQRVAQLKSQSDSLRAERARAQGEIDAAKARIGLSIQQLQDEFGLSSVEEAAQRLVELERELEAEVSAAEEALRRARGTNP